jgi:hypothetical protein
MRVGRFVAACCVLAGASVSGVAHGQNAATPVSSLNSAPAVPASPAQLEQARREAEDRLFWLGGPQARQERVASRTAFRGRLGVARARAIAVSRFGGMVTGPWWTQPRLAANERKIGMRGDRVMLVSRDGEPGGLVDSMVPLVATTEDGTRRPTDVSLVADANGFHARNPVVRSLIGSRLQDGVALPDDGLALLPQLPGSAAVGSVSQDRVFYADAATDTDVIVGATPTGAAINYQLRSPASPTELVLRVQMPEGAQLRPGADGSAQIATAADTLATISPPIAFDAQGKLVPSRYVVAEDTIRIAVDHGSGDLAYPILVDPVVDSYSTWRSDPSIPIFGWQYATPWPAPFPAATTGPFGRGLYISNAVQYFYSLTYGWWVYHAPGDAFIYRADFIGLYHQVAAGAGPSCMTTGIVNVRSGDWQRTPGTWQVQRPTGTVVADWRYDQIPRTSCQPMTNETYILWSDRNRGEFGEPGNAAAIQYWMYGNGNRTNAGRAYMAGSVIHMSDSQIPSITGGPPSTATDPNQTWSFSFIDQGLGSYQYLIDEPGNPGWDQTKVKWLGCYGSAWSPCPTGWQTVTARMGNLSPGLHTIRLQVWDGGSKIAQAFRTVNVAYPHPTSVRYGGADYTINTDAEVEAAIAAVGNGSATWEGLTDDDKVTLAAADAYVAWGEEAALDDPEGEIGTWEVSDTLEPVGEDFFPASDVIETYPDEGDYDYQGGPAIIIAIAVAGCKKFCDDAAKKLFKGGKNGVKKVKKPRPKNWKQRRPAKDWVVKAGSNPSQKLTANLTAAGRTRPSGWAAHHIVAAGSRYARKAQEILGRCGLGPNDAINGVYLPLTESARDAYNPADPRPRHGPIHTQWYYHNVNEIISKNYYGGTQTLESHETRCTRALEALNAIGDAIRANKFPY